MKRLVNIILPFSLIFLFSTSLFGQNLSGDGSKLSPYSGTFEGDPQWNISNFSNGKVFINGDITIDDEELVIEAGMKIIFVAEGADLILTGTGQIDATGSSGNEIFFTADDDDDGNYGETGERWGHIVFQYMDGEAGSSTFEYCNISYGDVRSGSNTTSYGGAIYINNFDNITISNSVISYSNATHGGALMLWNGASPMITNTDFNTNFAVTSGGAFYVHRASTSTIKNCLIYENESGNGGGGGFFLESVVDIDIYNSIVVNNSTTSSSRGANINFYTTNATSRPNIYNSIIWGSSNSVAYVNTSASSSDFTYCAIQDSETPASTFTNCFDLNSSNIDPEGPNFKDIVGPDYNWSIEFISPCRDTGTDTGAPTTDYAGNNRIGTTDIGAYEVQYSRWDGSTSTAWGTSSNWEQNIIPGEGTGDVVIPSGLSYYPTSTAVFWTIASGKYLILEPGTQATFSNLTNIGGNLMLESDATGIASLKVGTYTDTGGNEEIELFLTGGYTTDYEWHYVSSPLSAATASVFTSTTQSVLHYIESDVTTDPYEGWAWQNGLTNNGVSGAGFTNLSAGVGYNVYHGSDHTFTFTGGGLNTSTSSLSVGYTDNDVEINGYNLLGNPYTCYIDWQAVSDNTSPTFPSSSVNKAIYYNIADGWATYINGTSLKGGSRYIPPMQGFFVKTSANASISIPSTALVHNAQSYFKGAEIIPLIRLEVSNESVNDEMVIRFDNMAYEGFDNDFDALKLFRSSSKLLLWAKVEDKEYAILGTPFPDNTTEYNIEINIPDAGSYTISATQIDGLENYSAIYLIDTYQGNFSINLKETDEYAFSSEKGTFADRFIVSFLMTGIDDIITENNSINIYSFNNHLNIQTLANEWNGMSSDINVYDLTGRILSKYSSVELYMNETISLPFNQRKGVYLVEISAGSRRIVKKVYNR